MGFGITPTIPWSSRGNAAAALCEGLPAAGRGQRQVCSSWSGWPSGSQKPSHTAQQREPGSSFVHGDGSLARLGACISYCQRPVCKPVTQMLPPAGHGALGTACHPGPPAAEASAVHSGGKGPSQGTNAADRTQACGHCGGQSRSELPLNGRLCPGNGGGVTPSLLPGPSPCRTSRAGHSGHRRAGKEEGPAVPLRVGSLVWGFGCGSGVRASGVLDADWARARGGPRTGTARPPRPQCPAVRSTHGGGPDRRSHRAAGDGGGLRAPGSGAGLRGCRGWVGSGRCAALSPSPGGGGRAAEPGRGLGPPQLPPAGSLLRPPARRPALAAPSPRHAARGAPRGRTARCDRPPGAGHSPGAGRRGLPVVPGPERLLASGLRLRVLHLLLRDLLPAVLLPGPDLAHHRAAAEALSGLQTIAGIASAVILFVAVVATTICCFLCSCCYLYRRRQQLQSPFEGQEIPMTGVPVQPVYPYPQDPKAGPAAPQPGFMYPPSGPAPQYPLYPAGPPIYNPAAPPPYMPPQPSYPGA